MTAKLMTPTECAPPKRELRKQQVQRVKPDGHSARGAQTLWQIGSIIRRHAFRIKSGKFKTMFHLPWRLGVRGRDDKPRAARERRYHSARRTRLENANDCSVVAALERALDRLINAVRRARQNAGHEGASRRSDDVRDA